jgi:hypothetical protein
MAGGAASPEDGIGRLLGFCRSSEMSASRIAAV